MKKNIFTILLAYILSGLVLNVAAQSIIMGSVPFLTDIDDLPRVFYDPGGVPGDLGTNQDPNGYFAQGLRDTMTLGTSMSGTVLYLMFEEFAMGDGDTLWIFDGQNVDEPLYGVYNLAHSPGEVFASGRKMTFVFHSDNADIPGLQAGWRAKVYAYSTTPEIWNWPDYWNPAVVGTCNAWFYDSGGPDGNITTVDANDYIAQGYMEDIHVDFFSRAGTHIKCEFTQFSVNGVLQIYDGFYSDPNKRLIGQFCTSTLDASTGNMPPVLFSTDSALSFVYHGAAGDVNKAGWAAQITCVSELVAVNHDSPFLGITNVPLGAYAGISDPHSIQLDIANPTAVIEANINTTGQYTNDYTVTAIPFDSHVFAFDEGISISANNDDQWIPEVNIPFTFSFFGKQYTSVFPGTNGLISFNSHTGLCAYSYGVPPAAPPYNTSINGNQTHGGGSMTVPYNYNNSIYGVFEDVDGSYYNSYSFNTMGAIRYAVLGTYPCRAFVFNFLNVGLFGNHYSSSNYNTYQMVLYEGTNIIDVYVKHRACCATTNSSRHEGIIGLQNNTSSQILLAPGRGMTGWTADDEAWRFAPVTPLDPTAEFTWYADTVDLAAVVSHDRVITVQPQTDTRYISEYRCYNASGEMFFLRDTTLVLCPVIDSTGVTERNRDFEVWPNPTCDAVYVRMLNAEEMPAAIEVLDLQGRPLFSVPAETTTRVDLSRLPAGVYLLRTGKGSSVKIVRQ